jgi:hypothetical protein
MKRSHWIGLGLGFLVAMCFFGPFIFEPTDAPRFEDVKVVSDRSGFKGREYLTVVSKISGQSWEVAATRGPYPSEYRGPAVLSISRGRWTGKDHFRLLSARSQ